MRHTLLTKRQREVLQYRRRGMTQQQIADLIHTSKANICAIEKRIRHKIQSAEETLAFLAILDARLLCTLEAGSDLLDSVPVIIREAGKAGFALSDDPMGIVNRIRSRNGERIHGRFIKEKITIYMRDDGELLTG